MKRTTQKVSMIDIAEKLNISKNAVSIALSNKPGVSDELRSSVIKTAQELGYSLKRLTRSSNGKSKGNNILVLLPEYLCRDTGTYFYNVIYWSIERESKQHGYNSILANISKDAEKNCDLPPIFSEVAFCGIIIIGVFSLSYIQRLQKTGLPVISVDNYYSEISMDSVVTASIEGAYQITKYLIDCGHTKIGYIGSIMMTSSLYERWCGFQKAMMMNGLAINKDYCILDSSPLESLLGDINELERYLDNMKEYPTAWFCGGGRIAVTLINVLKRKGIEVPENISVAGYDDVDEYRYMVPSLTTVNVNRELLGTTAADILIKKHQTKSDHKKISIQGELIIRNSVKTVSGTNSTIDKQ